MRTAVRERLQAATGLVFVLLSLVTLFALPTPPAAGASAKDIASYFSVHNGAAQALGYIYLLAFLFFLWLIGYLRTVFARAEGETHHLSTLFCKERGNSPGTSSRLLMRWWSTGSRAEKPWEQSDSLSPAQSRASNHSRRSREQLPNTLGIHLMTREHLLRYALGRRKASELQA